jgi:hypothetical protein
MRPLLLVVFAILLLQAPTGASPKHDRAARAAWAWIAVAKAQEEAPAPAPVAGKCNCANGWKCNCSPCLCPGCPSKRGWTWSDEDGGYWWRNKPQPEPQIVEPYRQPAYIPAYNPVGFSRGGGRSGGC